MMQLFAVSEPLHAFLTVVGCIAVFILMIVVIIAAAIASADKEAKHHNRSHYTDN